MRERLWPWAGSRPIPKEALPTPFSLRWPDHYHFSLDTPFKDYPKKIQDILIHGTNGESVKVHYKGMRGEGVYNVAFEGLIRNMERKYRETGSEIIRQEYENFMMITPCGECGGKRLKRESLAVTVSDKNIAEITEMSHCRAFEFHEPSDAERTSADDRAARF